MSDKRSKYRSRPRKSKARKAKRAAVRETSAKYGRKAAPSAGSSRKRALTATIGKRGTLVLPAAIRKEMGLEEGSLVLLSPTREGLLLQPAEAVPIEIYTPERIAEFLLTSAVGEDDYGRARQDVRDMGLDPDKILHLKPGDPYPSAAAR